MCPFYFICKLDEISLGGQYWRFHGFILLQPSNLLVIQLAHTEVSLYTLSSHLSLHKVFYLELVLWCSCLNCFRSGYILTRNIALKNRDLMIFEHLEWFKSLVWIKKYLIPKISSCFGLLVCLWWHSSNTDWFWTFLWPPTCCPLPQSHGNGNFSPEYRSCWHW